MGVIVWGGWLWLLLRVDSLEHQEGSSEVSSALLSHTHCEGLAPLQLLDRGNVLHDADHLLHGRGRNAHQQRPAADRGNDVRGAVGDQDQSQVRAVFLHGPPERGLGIAGEVVGLIYDDDLEALARGNVDLLGLRNFLEQRLDDDAVVVADVGRGDFEVVHGGDDVEFDFAVGGGLEDARVDLDLFNAGTVELLEGGDDTGLFAGAGRAVDQQVGEVAGLGLGGLAGPGTDGGPGGSLECEYEYPGGGEWGRVEIGRRTSAFSLAFSPS